MALTQVNQGLLSTDAQYTGFKNRIINGAMTISQRGTSFTSTNVSNGDYDLDRWYAWLQNGSANATVTQSSTAPAGFINSFLFTNVTAVTVGSTDRAQLTQAIEGLNITDLAWGTASASPVTLSFWVRCSLTGQFGGSVQNSATNRSYPFSYTISAANTWEQKTITIAGDTTGTWLTTNGIGIQLNFDLGCGSTLKGTAGTWAATNYRGATGDVNLAANAGATFYITGVQLEKGSTATSFDYRPYGTELALCQRYFVRWKNSSSSDGSAWNPQVAPVQSGTTGNLSVTTALPVVMRTTATSVTTNLTNANYTTSWTLDSTYVTGNVTKTGTVSFSLTASAASVTLALIGATWSPNPNLFYIQNTSSYVDVSAEL